MSPKYREMEPGLPVPDAGATLPHAMTGSGLEALLRDIRRSRIGVIGDFCLDAYWDLDPSFSEISIETGLPTRAVRKQRYSLGGAGNVANNLAAMGVGRVAAFGVLGDDPFGREMLRILQSIGVETARVLAQGPGWATPVYIKPIEAGKEQGRIDFGGANALAPGVASALLGALREELGGLDLVIINQQLPRGVHTDEFRAGLRSLIAQSTVPFIVDSRAFSDSFDGAMRKLNDVEALRLCGIPWEKNAPVARETVARAALALFGRWGRPVFITRGPRGILGHEKTGAFEIPGLQIIGPVDTVGAGDSALAGIAAALSAGRGSAEAANLGNFVAGVTVRKLFTTGTASPQEILALGTDPDYVMRPELAEDSRSARFHANTEIEIISELPHGRAVRHVIFDFDGTVSTLREGWEKIMEPVMVRSIMGEGWERLPAQVYQEVVSRVKDYIDATTGVQTIVQMQGLVGMVRELGFVPESAIKNAGGYKADYDGELQVMVAERITRLQKGELSVDDFMIKGVVHFLEALKSAGVKMFLASGTDEKDVIREAGVLGVARFFEGRVMGSVGDPKVEAKKMVLQRIEAQVGPEGLRGLVTFGDGPVEMRETKKSGGYAVGVATDEPRRFGWNMGKRSRLVRGGADLIVADFLRWEDLFKILGVRP